MNICRQTAAAAVLPDPVEDFKDFAYIVSHDLAGPVRSIVGFSQLLKEQVAVLPNEEDRLHLELVLESGLKLNDMIQGLLAFSRLNAMTRAREVVDLEITLARCHMNLQKKMDAAHAVFTYPKMPEVMGDTSSLYTLFHALIDNAIKFARADVPPEIRILIDEAPDCWGFSVSDNGIGIDPIFFDDVFRPLRKLHTDDAYPGVGMGLTLARKIVGQHGGQIYIEASPGNGTTIHFSLAKSGLPV